MAVYEAKNNGKDFIIKDFNRAAEKIEKVKKEDIIGKSVLKVFPGVKDLGLFKVFQEVYKTGKPQHHPISLYKDQRITGWRENYVYKLPSGEIVAVYDDITEHKQAEEELKNSEEYLKILFDYAPDAYYISDIKGNFIDGNKAAERLTGYKKEELIGKSFLKLKLLSLADIPKAAKLLVKNLRGQPTGPDEFVLNRKDNSKVTVEISTYPVKIKGNTLALGIARDITERKQAEEVLKESEGKLRNIFENSTNLFYSHTPEHILTYLSPQVEDILGYTQKEAIIKWTKLTSDNPVNEIGFKYTVKAIETGKRQPPYELELVKKNGEKIWVEVREFPEIKDGKTIAIIGSLTEITERKQAEDTIKHQLAEITNYYKNIPIGLAIFNRDLRFLKINDMLAQINGIPAEEHLNKTVKEIVPALELQVLKITAEILRTGEPVKNIEFSGETLAEPGVKHVWLEGWYPLKDDSGKITGFSVIVQDITERKQAEERIKHLNLVLYAIRKVNQLIVREKDCEKLLKGACKNLIKTRGYYHARIVLLDEERKINTYTEAGLGKDFLPLVKLLKKGEITPCGRLALKKSDVVIIKDPVSACPDCPLVQACSARGSVMTARLEHAGMIYGVMSVSIPVHFITDKEEQTLFKEIAGDIALGLHNIEMREKLDKQTHDLQQSYQRTKRAMDATIETVSKIVEAKDPYTAGHQLRVSQLTTTIAKELNLSPDKIEGIRIASLIHDIGKISVPTEILSKSTTLSDIEFSLIKEHSRIGYDILKAIDFSYPVANIVLQHHEKINGSGYPGGLKGDEIFLEAKIICVADVVEAMSSHRPYRPALGVDKALEEITKNRSILYDPEVVDICLKLFKEKEFKFE